MTAAGRALGWLVAVLAVLATAALSRAPQRTGADESGVLRLSWAGRPDRIEVCRAVSESELANLPRHMRQPVICEGRSAEYRLQVLRDGDTLAAEPVWGGGVRHDRPIYLYREFPLAPGTHRLRVSFTRTDSASTADTARRGRLDQLPVMLALDTAVIVRARAVLLVTFDPASERLVLRTAE